MDGIKGDTCEIVVGRKVCPEGPKGDLGFPGQYGLYLLLFWDYFFIYIFFHVDVHI